MKKSKRGVISDRVVTVRLFSFQQSNFGGNLIWRYSPMSQYINS